MHTRALSAPPRAQTGMTTDQRRSLAKLEVLQDSRDWRGVVAVERNAKVVAATVGAADPGEASFVYSALGNAHESLGDFDKAVEYNTQHLASVQEVGDRAGEAREYSLYM